jgi:Fe-S cluster assembly protein SufD
MSVLSPIRTAGEEALLARLAQAPTAAGQAACAALATAGLPGRRAEAFRWSDLRAALADGLPEPSGEEPARPLFLPEDVLTIALRRDGVAVEGRPEPGLTLDIAESGAARSGEITAALAAGLSPRTLILKAEGRLERPVLVLRGAGAPGRLLLEVAEGASLTLVECAQAESGLSSLLIEAAVARGATLTRLSLQRGGAGAIDLSRADVRLEQAAAYRGAALAFGGRFARAETVVIMAGEGATCALDGAYLLDGALHADATTRVVHAAPGGSTRELYKGAVAGKARGVFQGKILVERAAQHTDARQNHHALLLTEGTEIDAKPELEIYADAVSCAHGNTIGALDEDALFYARARGIPEAAARALLVEAFIAEAFDAVEDEAARAWLHALAAGWLEARR